VKKHSNNTATIQYNHAMQDENDNSDDALSLFQQAMGDVRPLKEDRRIQHQRQKPSPRPRQRERDEQQVIQDMMSDPIDLADVEIGDEILFSRNGVQHKTFKKLRRGEYAVEAELDLHGKTVDEARALVAEFLALCQRNAIRCVRIIHGKGHGSFNKQPVIKTHINYWLRQRDEVLAFCSCRPNHGGTGAIYVLLRKK
jgi:DNA-nicking Smr family endonuclease